MSIEPRGNDGGGLDFTTIHLIFEIIAFLFAISVHESAHAWSAYRLGDDTASLMGRISLNPIHHIDLVGTILMPAIAAITGVPLIGWAKPTPVNLLRLKNRYRDNALVAAAGPISNFLVATVALIILLVLRTASPDAATAILGIAGYQSMPTGESIMNPLVLLLYSFMFINVLLAVFNLFPIPPLDGSHVLEAFLPDSARETYASVGMWGTFILMILLWQTNIFGRMVAPPLHFFDSLLLIHFR